MNVSQRPRYLRTDLHLHSTFSDGHSSVAQLVERATRIGFVFAISDHYSSLMPMPARRSGGTDAWVMPPGCSMSDSTPPRLSASVKSLVWLSTR